MGFGVKTDHATGRHLDLDKTYENIIKPAAQEAGLKCVRADEIRHSGIIDVPMYRYLIEADIVIADLSTSNPNAFYELGVRHALRPRTTIAISESKLKPPFDINHTVIHQYEHLEKDIGYSEVKRFKGDLIETIMAIQETKEIDSPVYTYLEGLTPPKLKDMIEIPDKVDNEKETLSIIITSAKEALELDEFITAKALFNHAKIIAPNNDYVIQKLTLATYKSESPTKIEALESALKIIMQLDLFSTTDPETLGLAGAIYKRLWEQEGTKEHLSTSIHYYEKGFYIKNDYYNGINLAYMLNLRSNNQTDYNESLADFILANRVSREVIKLCKGLKGSSNYNDRSDKYWIEATLEEAYFGLVEEENYNKAKKEAVFLSTENWERKSTEDQLIKLEKIKRASTLQIDT